MKILKSFARNRPIGFVLVLMIVWFLLVMIFTGIASSALGKPYGDVTTATIGRLAVTACLLLLLWGLDWLDGAGVTRLGYWQVWLLALIGMLYFTSVSLYSFYGKVAFDFSSLIRLPDSRTLVLTHFVAGLSEEILFRGMALYGLVRVWGSSKQRMIGSVLLTSLLFAVVHITQVFTHGVNLSSALFLILETWIISIWWGALVLLGRSIWPAVILHFVVNAAVAVQGLTVSMIEPDILAYGRILLFSIPLGILGIWLFTQVTPKPYISDVH